MKESRGFLQGSKKEKYNVADGGKNPSGPNYFIAPTIVDGDGTTGPTVPLLSFGTYEEAITKANNIPYGLGASGTVVQCRASEQDRGTK
jgi:acyl-CoA reductase-like NAD-dependent aldehyde dehydrogenase